MFHPMLSLVVRAFVKCEVKRGSLSEMTLDGTLNQGKRYFMYSNATPSLVIVVLQGIKVATLEHPWSTTVRMASCPLAFGSWVIRSSVMTLNGHMEGSPGIQYSRVFFIMVCTLLCWQWAHPVTYLSTHVFIPGHQ